MPTCGVPLAPHGSQCGKAKGHSGAHATLLDEMLKEVSGRSRAVGVSAAEFAKRMAEVRLTGATVGRSLGKTEAKDAYDVLMTPGHTVVLLLDPLTGNARELTDVEVEVDLRHRHVADPGTVVTMSLRGTVDYASSAGTWARTDTPDASESSRGRLTTSPGVSAGSTASDVAATATIPVTARITTSPTASPYAPSHTWSQKQIAEFRMHALREAAYLHRVAGVAQGYPGASPPGVTTSGTAAMPVMPWIDPHVVATTAQRLFNYLETGM